MDSVVADSGEQALALLREAEFNLVLLDVMLPELNGWDVLEVARRRFNARSSRRYGGPAMHWAVPHERRWLLTGRFSWRLAIVASLVLTNDRGADRPASSQRGAVCTGS